MTPDDRAATDLASSQPHEHQATRRRSPRRHREGVSDMPRSVVDTEQIAAAAGDINRLADTITSSTAELRGRLAGLGADWQGPAKVEFERVMHDYQRIQAQMTD